MRKMPSERMILFIVASIQFINVLDFMIVMPLGPDFAAALGIPLSELGGIAGSYTAAAAVSGLAGAFFLDRFDRRSALALAMLGLVVGTAAGGFATGFGSLMAARVLAGLFGGPATSLAISIIADVIPPERRGRAMGAVMGAFAFASVFGVPAGLELSRIGGWQLPFFAVAALGLVLTALATFYLPPLRGHLAGGGGPRGAKAAWKELWAILGRRTVLLTYSASALLMMGAFIILPNLPAYIQFNLGYPRERLGMLYLVGGAISFFSMRAAGILVDRFGSARMATISSLMFGGILYAGFYAPVPGLPVLALFVAVMITNTFRNVSYSTLSSKVPLPAERARFTSIQSAVQHLAGALAAFSSSKLLVELPDKRLDGVPRIAVIAMALTLAAPPLLWFVERLVAARPPAPAGNASGRAGVEAAEGAGVAGPGAAPGEAAAGVKDA